MNLNIRKVELLLQALDFLAIHHNEAGIELTQLGEISELAKEIKAAPNQWSIPVGIETTQTNAKEAVGLGHK